MKKNLLIALTFLCLTIASVLVLARTGPVAERFALKTHFNMEILDDGELSDNKMVVDLTIIEQDGGGFYVEWNEVYIDPVHEAKVVILKPFFHSTQERSIRNVTVTGKGFSFLIDLSGQPLGKGRTLQIVGTKKDKSLIPNKYVVKGSGLWWSDILNKSIKKELRSTDTRIVLPYREVY